MCKSTSTKEQCWSKSFNHLDWLLFGYRWSNIYNCCMSLYVHASLCYTDCICVLLLSLGFLLCRYIVYCNSWPCTIKSILQYQYWNFSEAFWVFQAFLWSSFVFSLFQYIYIWNGWIGLAIYMCVYLLHCVYFDACVCVYATLCAWIVMHFRTKMFNLS